MEKIKLNWRRENNGAWSPSDGGRGLCHEQYIKSGRLGQETLGGSSV